uniref:NADH dehydrogenase subunit 4L n=1 Tax=Decipisagitta decipiens TaxID=366427 RepID=D3DKM8_9BILA|nr:NADH dehydrogenase subunit 4L [Decipisagitta decipiens]BAI68177.1 NADH dehydrogenase subunit 4L [Decipisagitta decipiens]
MSSLQIFWFYLFRLIILLVFAWVRYFACFILFFAVYKHKNFVLSLLITLEALILCFFILFILESDLFFSIIFMCIAACEAAIGLASLIGIIRLTGNIYLSSIQ